MSEHDVLPSATRRVKLTFDKNGDPAFPIVTSPECFKQNALGVLPPRDVIPVIFVPGIAGSNLRTKDTKEDVWAPPNGVFSGLWDAFKTKWRSISELQRRFDPENTEVNPNGKCSVGSNTYWLTTKEVKKRGWGSVHAMSYGEFLQRLEVSLNDQYTKPGHTKEKGNHLLGEIGMHQYLGGDPDKGIYGGNKPRSDIEEAAERLSYSERPDYARLAYETMFAWGRSPVALTEEEIGKLDDYYYPVWACGYDWVGDPEKAAESLNKYIETVLAHYSKSNYFRHQEKVIIVTHSMGGLIARRAAQKMPDKILGVVHGVCPLIGAAVLYRRLRAGQEGGGGIPGMVASAIMGNTQEEMTSQLGRSPGAFTLAPTKDYMSHWFKVYAGEKEDEKDLVFSLPESDPYTEIYAKTTEDVWWGMFDPSIFDSSKVMTEKNKKTTPTVAYRKAIKLAKEFHDVLKLYAHPETYGFYGTDNDGFKSFGHVSWLCRGDKYVTSVIQGEYADKTSREVIKSAQLSTRISRTGRDNGAAYVMLPRKTPVRSSADPKEWMIRFVLSEERNMPGDGTVPTCSGEMLKKLSSSPDGKPTLKEVFGIPGYDHQKAFNDEHVYRATIYCIIRIVHKAAPAMPFC